MPAPAPTFTIDGYLDVKDDPVKTMAIESHLLDHFGADHLLALYDEATAHALESLPKLAHATPDPAKLILPLTAYDHTDAAFDLSYGGNVPATAAPSVDILQYGLADKCLQGMFQTYVLNLTPEKDGVQGGGSGGALHFILRNARHGVDSPFQTFMAVDCFSDKFIGLQTTSPDENGFGEARRARQDAFIGLTHVDADRRGKGVGDMLWSRSIAHLDEYLLTHPEFKTKAPATEPHSLKVASFAPAAMGAQARSAADFQLVTWKTMKTEAENEQRLALYARLIQSPHFP